MREKSAHIDSFAAANLPRPEMLPDLIFTRPELQYPSRLNCAAELLDRAVVEGDGDRPAILAHGLRWTYAELQDKDKALKALQDEHVGCDVKMMALKAHGKELEQQLARMHSEIRSSDQQLSYRRRCSYCEIL